MKYEYNFLRGTKATTVHVYVSATKEFSKPPTIINTLGSDGERDYNSPI